jgi:rRNA maturation RNase YbeY
MIRFYSDDIDLPAIHQPELIVWIRHVITSQGKELGDINIIFCSDDRMLEINRKFLEHDYYTDIITFDYSTENLLTGDIYISLETVASNAKELGHPYEQELHRVIIHGILHLCGFKDKTALEIQKMRQLEDEALSALDYK